MAQNQISAEQLIRSAGEAHRMAREAIKIAQANGELVGGMRQALEASLTNAKALESALKAISMNRGGSNPSLQYVENIPGRRVPFDFLVDVPIGANVSSVQQGTFTVSQEGPFVAVARYATFQSQYQFQRRDPETGIATTFQGRSFGRYRPIHSAWDLNDGLPRSEVFQALAFPGNSAPHMLSPSNGASFRTMQPDFRIKFENAGSSFPRSNQEVPSTFWTTEINSPFELGALDVWERGEVLTVKILPTHINNPSFGNISGFGAVNGAFPFLASQFDYIEGINDQEDAAAESTDPITRLPEGILTIGFHGYKIIQPAGISGGY
jgi:hypothetical protein